MFKSLNITQNHCQRMYSFTEDVEMKETLTIKYSDTGVITFADDDESKYNEVVTLPAMTEDEWEEFKRAGDTAFKLMK